MSDRAGRTGWRRRALGAFLAASLAAVGACGGDDDDDSAQGGKEQTEATGPVLTAEALKTQANARCQAYRQRTEALALAAARKEGAGLSPTVGEMREYVEATLPEFEQLLSELSALRAPADLEQTFQDTIDAGRRAITEAEEIKQDNQKLLSRAYGDAFLLFNRAAHFLGFDSCVAE